MNIKKSILASALALLTVICASSKTTVYLFIPKVANTDITLFIDGQQIAKLNTPVSKTTNDAIFKIPYKQQQSGWVEIEFANDEKVLLAVSMDYTNPMSLKKSTMQAESQLDLQDGETIYLEISRKGWTDCQLKILNEKKGLKKINDKKAYELPKIEINND